MKGTDVVSSLKRKFGTKTEAELARRLGIVQLSLANWKKSSNVTARQVAGLVHKACMRSVEDAAKKVVRPIVEFFPLDKCRSAHGQYYELFATELNGGKPRRYHNGLRAELKRCKGIYVFFDSRGQAIYAGRAQQRSLWDEMKNAFNRNRGEVQQILRVRHPVKKRGYKTSEEKARQIAPAIVPIHELASYFSAYEVAEGLIHDVEAMLVRCFANDLLNIRMERFGQQRRTARQK